MKISQLLNICTDAGIALSVKDGELKALAAKGAVTADILQLLKENKQELIRYLNNDSIASDEVQAIVPRDKAAASPPLSFAQQRLWFIDRLGEGSTQYNEQGVFELNEPFVEAAFRSALKKVIERHETLRTHFVEVEGEPRQVIDQEVELPCVVCDLSTLDAKERDSKVGWYLQDEMGTAFRLDQAPLLRVRVLKLAVDRHLVVYTLHHIISDGWSMQLFRTELSSLYAVEREGLENELPELGIQYADYALWQRNWLQGEVLDRHVRYWRERLKGAPPIHGLPLDKPRPRYQTSEGKVRYRMLDSVTAEKIREVCRERGVTPFMFFQTTFAILLGRYSNTSDIVVGVPISGRVRKEVEGLIGFFINSLVLRTDLSGNPRFSRLLQENRQHILDAYTHQHLPFEMLVEAIKPERHLSHNPLFQILFALHNENKAQAPATLQDVRDRRDNDPHAGDTPSAHKTATRFDLELHIYDGDRALSIGWLYNTALFNDGTISRLAINYEILLRSVVEGLDRGREAEPGIDELQVLSREERQQLLSRWNSTDKEHSGPTSIHSLVERQAAILPDSVAVVSDDVVLTYGELNAQANRLARYLKEQGVVPGTMVAWKGGRSANMLIGLLAILKSGAVYLPLDDKCPPARIRYMVADSRVRLMLTDTDRAADQDESTDSWLPACVVHLNAHFRSTVLSRFDDADPDATAFGLTPESIAYVIYTSGSTGKPKGVIGSHRGMVNRLRWLMLEYPIGRNEVFSQKTSLGFVDHLAEIFQPLSGGRPLVVIPDEEVVDTRLFVRQIKKHGITRLTLVPSLLRALLESEDVEEMGSLRYVVCSGEALIMSVLKLFLKKLPDVNLINLYGATEVTADVSSYTVNSQSYPEIMQYFALDKDHAIWDELNSFTVRSHQSLAEPPAGRPALEMSVLRNRFIGTTLPVHPVSLDEYIDDLSADVIPNLVDVSSQKFIGHMTSVLPSFMPAFSKLITRLNQNVVKVETSKCFTFMERQVLAMMHKLFFELPEAHYEAHCQDPDHMFGIVTSGGSIANVNALWCARNKGLIGKGVTKKRLSERGAHAIQGELGFTRSVIIGSRLLHYSIRKTASLLGIGEDSVLILRQEDSQQLSMTALELCIQECLERGHFIIALVGVAGATETGTIDPLEQMADIAEKYQIHFHVDAAWGGALQFSDKYRVKLRGIERADSITFCPHKQLNMPQGMSLCLFRDSLSFGSIATHATYQAQEGSYDLGQYTLEGSRPAVSILLHASLHLLSKKGYSWLVDRSMSMTGYFRTLIESSACFELMGEPDLNIVNYRYIPSSLRNKTPGEYSREDNEAISALVEHIQKRQFELGGSFVSKTRLVNVRFANYPLSVFRVVLGNPRTTHEDLREVLADQLRIVEELTGSLGKDELSALVELPEQLAFDQAELDRWNVPIGRPIHNNRLYVLNGALNLLPVGAVGELCVSGVGLAKGYLNQPELTRERFVDNPYGTYPHTTLYKTGDLARWLPSGELEYLGRIDDQVKIRGFRIELGEIEAQLSRLDGVRHCVVVAREGRNYEKCLVAYVEPLAPDPGPDRIGSLPEYYQSALRASLPDYMVPGIFVILAQMPFTAGGKLDKAALPAPNDEHLNREHYAAPRNSTEEVLCGLWRKLLGVERVGIHANFFSLGGHSLLATRLISAIRHEFKLELPLRALFEAPTIAGLAAKMQRDDAAFVIPPIHRADRNQFLPLSYAQQRLWFIDRLGEGSAHYNMSGSYLFSGKFRLGAFKKALKSLLERHEVLRTHFADEGGRVRQVIAETYRLPLTYLDLRAMNADEREAEIRALSRREAATAFDLGSDLMLRVSILRLEQSLHLILYTAHHIACDGWSSAILQNELSLLYNAYSSNVKPALEPLQIQYADFALWQQQWLQGDVLTRQLDYWRNQLAGIPPVHKLILDKPRPEQQTFVGRLVRARIGAATVGRVRNLCRREGVTPFIFLQTVFSVLLYRYTNAQDIVVGFPIAGRPHKDVENLIGFFVNSLTLRTDFSAGPTFEQLLQQNKQVILDAYEHQHIPFEMLVEKIRPERHLNHNPLFQITFALHNNERGAVALQGQDAAVRERFPSAGAEDSTNIRNDLELHMMEAGDELLVAWLYNDALFERQSLERMAANYGVLLESVCDSLEQSLTEPCDVVELELLTAEERQQLLTQWNGTQKDYARDTLIHRLFEETAAQDPDRVAFEFNAMRLTYAALNERANRLAHYLIGLGVRADTLVLLCLERSLEMAVGILGILKAGGAYVPLDPTHPPARLAYMCQDSGASVVLTQEGLLNAAALEGRVAVHVDGSNIPGGLSSCACHDPEPAALDLSPASLAYVLYTSGSTGLPKGVMIEHGSVVNLGYNLAECVDDGRPLACHRWALNAGYYFDASVQALTQLTLGMTVSLIPEAVRKSPEVLAVFLRDQQISVFDCTPLQLKLLLEVHDGGDLPTIVVGGERIGESLWAAMLALHQDGKAKIINAYGPTEACVDSHLYRVRGGTESIGTYVNNVTGYVLANGHPLPVGAEGELYLGGAGLSRGYLNRPDLTEEKFVPNPFASGGKERLYRTGDLVRYCGDGRLEYRGRIDDQTKVRGFRIELGEIEALLSAHEAIGNAVVTVSHRDAGAEQLVAYICPTSAYMDKAARDFNAGNLARWTRVFDDQYQEPAEQQVEAGYDFIGWNSSYTGLPIEESQMKEWQSGTLSVIAAMNPSSLVEIGCGTGLLLYHYAPWCKRVHGTDISDKGLARIQWKLGRMDWSHVTLEQGDALSFERIAELEFDAAVINSVAQYFPNRLYLEQAVEGLLRHIQHGGRILLGDLRNFDLLTAHAAAVERSRLNQSTTMEVLANRVQRRIQQEPELLISPGFFIRLAERLPEIAKVDILVKRGLGDNEMLRYRYDVVITKASHGDPATAAGALQWFDYQSMDALKALVGSRSQEVFGVSGVPNGRIMDDVMLAEGLVSWQGERLVYPEEDKGRLSAGAVESIGALESLLRAAEEAGYRCAMTWSQSRLDKLDIIFSTTTLPAIQARHPYPRLHPTNYPQLGNLTSALTKELKSYLDAQLPDYMIPAVYIAMEKLPTTANGKVNKRALPLLLETDLQRGDYAAPRNTNEELLCEIWCELLGIKAVGIHDNFFALGGHSLLATRLVSAIRQSFAVELPLRVVFQSPTIADLGLALETGKGEFILPPVARVDRSRDLPLSYAQQRLWFIDQLGDGSSVQYNVSGAYPLPGEFHLAAFQQAVDRLLQRHETLRTRFVAVSGEARQVIAQAWDVPVVYADLSGFEGAAKDAELARLTSEAKSTPFNLSEDLMLRVRVVKLEEHKHLVVYCMHHIASDGWSTGILRHELELLYRACRDGSENPLPELRVQYVDYACWQRNWLQGEILQRQLNYWRERLQGIPPVHSLPLDRPRPREQRYDGKALFQVIDGRTDERIKAACERHGVTFFMFMETVFAVLLRRYSNETDIVVGTPISGRTHRDFEALIGFFVNALILRTDLSGNPTFGELLARNREGILEAYTHQHIQFERLVEELRPERNLNHNPLIQIMFVGQNDGASRQALRDGELLEPPEDGAMIERGVTTRFDMEVYLREGDEGAISTWIYNASLFEDGTIERMAANFRVLLRAVLDEADGERYGSGIGDLPLLDDAEREKLLVAWNDTAASYPVNSTLHQLFEQQVERTPDAVALAYEESCLSYSELNRRAGRLAGILVGAGVAMDVRVAVCAERSLELVIALLGILKAGGCYVPIDPSYPQERISYMLEDARADIMLSQSGLAERFECSVHRLIFLDGDYAATEHCDYPASSGATCADSLAYVIYTSGSTGRPKGAAVSHGAIVNRLHWMQECYRLTARDKVLQKTSSSFDVSVWEFFWPILTGAELVMARPGGQGDPSYIVDVVRRKDISVLHFVPSVLAALLASADWSACTSVRQTICSGEALDRKLQEDFFRTGTSSRLDNLYGPTEAAVDVSYWPCFDGSPRAVVPIGRPIYNIRLYVTDTHLRPVPTGVVGELLIGGVGLARGYLGKSALTAEKFVPDPFASSPGRRLYRTGDLARWSPDGNLEFLGRKDHQVKIRGLRIELGEIENALQGHEAVANALIVANEQHLIAYVVPEPGSARPVAVLHRLLKEVREEKKHAIRTRNLPNGLTTAYLNQEESEFLYGEIFDRQSYLKNGITLSTGACVFDVGANTGMFSLLVTQLFPDARLHAFEPIPQVFDALAFNASLYDMNIRLHPYGLGEKEQEVTFTHYQHNTLMSSRFGSASADRDDVMAYLKNKHRKELEEGILSAAEFDEMLKERMQGERVVCRLRTLSDVIAEEGIERVDLLKVDVEKGEMDVLSGIAEDDWPRIKQLIIEVHAIGSRLDDVKMLLKEKGFNWTLEQEELLAGTPLYVIYAIHRTYAPAAVTQPASIRDRRKYRWNSAKALAGDLRDFLGRVLPAYMIPETCVFLDGFPLNSNGKIDRKALPGPNDSDLQKQEYVAPGNEVEKRICGIWESLLKTERVGTQDNFFALGGHSLLATRLISTLRHEFGVELPLRHLFESPTVAGIAAHIALSGGGEVVLPPLTRADRNRDIPLSNAQQRLWFIDQLGRGSAQYNVPTRYVLTGGFDEEAFKRALRALIDRHEALRTHFISKQGQPLQVIATEYDLPYSYHDLSLLPEDERAVQVEALLQQHAETAFDLGRDLMVRVTVARISADVALVLQTLHHIACDGWSVGVLKKELRDLYGAFASGFDNPLESLPLQYADYALWQREWLQSGVVGKQLAYWKKQLAGIPRVHGLPLDKPRPATPTFKGKLHQQVFDRSLAEKIRLLCEIHKVSVFMFLQTAFAVLLHRYTRDADIVIGTPVSGRNHRDLENLVGFFVNALVLRTDLRGNPSFSKLLQANKQVFLDAYDNQHLPFEVLVEEMNHDRNINHNPLYQIVFAGQNFDESESERSRIPGRDAVNAEAEARQSIRGIHEGAINTRFDLEVHVFEAREQVILGWIHDQALFEDSSIVRLLENFEVLVRNIVMSLLEGNTPEPGIEQLGLLGEREKASQLQWSRAKTAYPENGLVARACGNGWAQERGESHLYVLDRHGLPTPIGSVGELYVACAANVRDVDSPGDVDAAVANPLLMHAADRLYRTGEPARWRCDGRLVFAATDAQVRSKEFARHLVLVEELLASHPGIMQAVAIPATGDAADNTYNAFVIRDERVADADETLSRQLRSYLRKQYPLLPLPLHVQVLQAFPLDGAGGIDARRLSASLAARSEPAVYVAPSNETERSLCSLFEELLGIEKVGVNARFFSLGGHSLMAMRLLSSIRQAFQVEFPLKKLFENPAVADISEYVSLQIDANKMQEQKHLLEQFDGEIEEGVF